MNMNMNCSCGDPSCGYCQAARGANSNNYYPFGDFVPMDPYDMSLNTIIEEDEDKDDDDVDEQENEQDDFVDAMGEMMIQQEIDAGGISFTQINELQVSTITTRMSEYSGAGSSSSSYFSPFGDYDNPSGEPSPKCIKMTPPTVLLSPSFSFSQLNIAAPRSAGSLESEESEDESPKAEQLLQFEQLFKQSLLGLNQFSPNVINSSNDERVEMGSEDEKKRLRNTEAARRCREKIKRKTEDLEEELHVLLARNEIMNEHRVRILSQIQEHVRTMNIMIERNPALERPLRYQAAEIVAVYHKQIEMKRKAIQDYWNNTCNKSY
ncbi:CRE-ZIP-5 protein [Caenorhabditis remanei]|uniref:CRE-ZIP-5 protein n=1 Tax=Caenorhabditis remanei TaxID=31234 RepID=E3LU72_CAERE|nr:CRE-ZIP-5 protein [Caenorhabditis remanei]